MYAGLDPFGKQPMFIDLVAALPAGSCRTSTGGVRFRDSPPGASNPLVDCQ